MDDKLEKENDELEDKFIASHCKICYKVINTRLEMRRHMYVSHVFNLVFKFSWEGWENSEASQLDREKRRNRAVCHRPTSRADQDDDVGPQKLGQTVA